MFYKKTLKCVLLILLTLSVSVMILGCTSSEDTSTNDDVITIFAASSLMEVLDCEIDAFVEKTGIEVQVYYAGSQTLRRQIQNGADADITLFANEKEHLDLKDNEMYIEETIFATNQVVLASHHLSEISTCDDLLKGEYKVIIGDDSVPIGQYTSQLMDALDEEGQQEVQLYLESHIVSKELSASQIKRKLEQGVCDVGFVYQTDISEEIVLIEGFKPSVETSYYMGLISEKGRSFYDYILSEEGQNILIDRGFGGIHEN